MPAWPPRPVALRVALLALAGAWFLGSCSADQPVGPSDAPAGSPDPVAPIPSSVLVSPATLTLASLGDTVRLAAEVRDRNGTVMPTATVTWSSDPPAVASVDAAGLLTAVANGSATITARAGSVVGTSAVTVQQAPESIVLSPDSVTFQAVGDTATIVARVTDANGHEVAGAMVAWASRDPSVATVDSTGLVTAIRSGSTEVTATVGSLATSAAVEVLNSSTDREVLEYLYRTTGGDGWRDNTNWLTDAPLSEWAGVTAYRNGRVRYLDLYNNNLKGTIPRSLGRLDELFILNLDGNSLNGPIPPEIGQLRRLRDLSLSRNEISGPLPTELGNLASLRDLRIWDTDLSGPVPDTFAGLALGVFYIHGTELCLPRQLRDWYESIEETDDDPLHCIPATPDREALVALYGTTGGPAWDDNENWLSDLPINTWRGVTTDEDGYVTRIVLRGNNLAGAIPGALGSLSRLEELVLSSNTLSGRIPSELGDLTLLKKLWLPDNLLAGSIPSELGNLGRLDTLSLAYNSLSGPIPATFGNLTSLEQLLLYDNELSGPLPSELGRLKRLRHFSLTNNQIEGPLPPAIGGMTALEYLSLTRNAVTGTIPPEFENLEHLEVLSLGGNQLHGAIPPELGNMTSLKDLILSRNRLSGAIPPELLTDF